MKSILPVLPILLTLFASSAGATDRTHTPMPDDVIVLGALHAMHETESSFDYESLREIISSFDPDLMVLEVKPTELAKLSDTRGRPEYPEVLWPMLSSYEGTVVAMEPDGDLYNELTGAASQAFGDLTARSENDWDALNSHNAATKAVLQAYWTNIARTQDSTTAALATGFYEAQVALAGDTYAKAQTRWEAFMSEEAKNAVLSHSNKRVLVLGSYKNRHILEAAIRDVADERLVSADSWIRENW
ncbi:MAG: hypothetical protein AAF311_04735 [Pseudomonadota bacterium]